ncbi:MAG: hypothetical protein A3H88_01215 [Candidatus Blackburnbacteria bacterium RIFCSPLOWO2_02_FULL_44_9]|uniref:Uncharacterized protein n=1 Tax=Candidatus Blackburnbacteria bacterium RIFCSPHIGHO2_02_FULL_44_20 TaxID=1797516 RepID=A0A1G1V595_9BACT|nr:MAG: hypothetical protein A3D26_00530 [Candidatus Blackburnbacteria bacterium RIFCSPHIGHO2_02_FULL_44_20]OGY11650.1 MAG: hypothetical protein A3E16_01505 [Candidatus Blackburnbacteria bacterium RIFCSPHIGHO2_12_FULL_44_25]OGY13912.1 MAG: hypothetical protein A3A62_02450 [Candidatus Blackburnbacteria bacterium RIFCSPLOWO2_01_FULL_44_43]OGY17478.1 MAG: hypothetical protein A3H88_01215 [Candidatus Blackburnbacteria bacterium RIFCSPLOWO2_02_FULL_44_9]
MGTTTAEATGVRGTLWQLFHVLRSPDNDGKERFLMFKWLSLVGTFEELLVAIDGAHNYYQLAFDDRLPQEHRTAKPGYLVFGVEYPGQTREQAHAVGVFIPEGREDEVVMWLAKESLGVVFFPMTLGEIAQVLPGATLTLA